MLWKKAINQRSMALPNPSRPPNPSTHTHFHHIPNPSNPTNHRPNSTSPTRYCSWSSDLMTTRRNLGKHRDCVWDEHCTWTLLCSGLRAHQSLFTQLFTCVRACLLVYRLVCVCVCLLSSLLTIQDRVHNRGTKKRMHRSSCQDLTLDEAAL